MSQSGTAMPVSGRFQDLTGRTFGRWTVISFQGCNVRHHSEWMCRCECGTQKITLGTYLLCGQSLSCGRCVANMSTAEYDVIAMRRLMASVAVSPSGCWEWQKKPEPNGYGRTTYRRRRIGSHVLSYQLHRGVIPHGMYVCHTCDNRVCVNPDHLFLGTHQENVDDMVSKGRHFHPTGERHGRAKLTESQVTEIKSLCDSGESTQDQIAAMFGVQRTTVSSIACGRNWGYLTRVDDSFDSIEVENDSYSTAVFSGW